jgi:hypothetical protein
MPNKDVGPPRNEVGPRDTTPEGTDNLITTRATTTATSTMSLSGAGTRCGADTIPVQLRRRRHATGRCEPLASGHRDSWQPWRSEKLSDRQIDGAVDAAQHLRDAGLEPMFDLDTLRAMWKAGHHQLVDDLRGGGR